MINDLYMYINMYLILYANGPARINYASTNNANFFKLALLEEFLNLIGYYVRR